jgi:hypothetical protein
MFDTLANFIPSYMAHFICPAHMLIFQIFGARNLGKRYGFCRGACTCMFTNMCRRTLDRKKPKRRERSSWLLPRMFVRGPRSSTNDRLQQLAAQGFPTQCPCIGWTKYALLAFRLRHRFATHGFFPLEQIGLYEFEYLPDVIV